MSFFKSPVWLFIVLLFLGDSPIIALTQEEKANCSEKIEILDERAFVEIDEIDMAREMIKLGIGLYCAYTIGSILGKAFVRAHPDWFITTR